MPIEISILDDPISDDDSDYIKLLKMERQGKKGLRDRELKDKRLEMAFELLKIELPAVRHAFGQDDGKKAQEKACKNLVGLADILISANEELPIGITNANSEQ